MFIRERKLFVIQIRELLERIRKIGDEESQREYEKKEGRKVESNKYKLSKGKICVANFIPPANGASHSSISCSLLHQIS